MMKYVKYKYNLKEYLIERAPVDQSIQNMWVQWHYSEEIMEFILLFCAK